MDPSSFCKRALASVVIANSFADVRVGMILSRARTQSGDQVAAAERKQLKQWVTPHGTPQQVALRCRIILGAAAGEDNGDRCDWK